MRFARSGLVSLPGLGLWLLPLSFRILRNLLPTVRRRTAGDADFVGASSEMERTRRAMESKRLSGVRVSEPLWGMLVHSFGSC